MLIMKKTRHALFILILSGLCGQIEEEKKPKTFLFGLIKFDTESAYEEGAWFDKWFHAREFAAPVNMIPVEIHYGIGFNGKTSGSASKTIQVRSNTMKLWIRNNTSFRSFSICGGHPWKWMWA